MIAQRRPRAQTSERRISEGPSARTHRLLTILPTVRFGVLGSLGVWSADGEAVGVGGPQLRALLLLNVGRTVGVRRLVEGRYGPQAPSGAAHSLQSQVSRLRRRLGAAGETGDLLEFGPIVDENALVIVLITGAGYRSMYKQVVEARGLADRVPDAGADDLSAAGGAGWGLRAVWGRIGRCTGTRRRGCG